MSDPMSLDEEFALYLHEMGLSEYEASSYLALLQQGTSTAKMIASTADIPQSRVYDVLDDLERKGFVTVQPGRPKKFGPIEPEIAVSQYTDYRRQQLEAEIDHTRKIGDQFVNDLDEQQFQYRQNDEIDVFWSYKGKNYILEQFGQYCESVDDRIRMITKGNSFRRMVSHYKELLSKQHEHGVDIEIILPCSGADSVVLDTAQEWATIRHMPGIEGRLYLFDDDRILIAFRSDTQDRFVAMSTQSSQLYSTMERMFETFWAATTDPIEAE
jgi:sugar-specific transcriptional regulator TrmB